MKKGLLVLKFLLPCVCAAYLYYNRESENYVVVTCLFLLAWSLSTAWTSWKKYQGETIPKVSSEGQIPDEIVLHYPNWRRYIWNVLFNPEAYHQKTWNILLSIVYMTYIAIAFKVLIALLMVISAVFTFVTFTMRRYNADKKTHESYSKGFDVVVGKEGIYQTFSLLGTGKGRERINISFTDWADVNSLCFYGNYAQIIHNGTKFSVLFFDKKEQKRLVKAYRGLHSANKQEKIQVLTVENKSNHLGSLSYTSFKVITEPCNSFHLGDSYIAPIPSVPEGFKWPIFHKKPLDFIAQINCADLYKGSINKLIPKTGMLYFFYDWHEMLLNSAGNNGCARIYYSNEPVNELHFAKDEVRNLNQLYLLRQQKLIFGTQHNLPNYTKASKLSDVVAHTNEATYRNVSKHFLNTGYNNYDDVEGQIGYMLDDPAMTPSRNKGLDDCADLELLLQLNIDKMDFYGYASSFSDYSERGTGVREFYDHWPELPCRLYYFVPREDLKRLDFSNLRFACRSSIAEDVQIDIPDSFRPR